jgi:hypothetical protein
MWPNGAEIHYAILDDMSSMRHDNVVEAGDIQTALSLYHVWRCSVFRVGSDLFFSVLGSTSATERDWFRIYKANSASNPTSWSMHAELNPGQNWTLSGYIHFGGTMISGVPLILDSGRWVITGALAITNHSFTGWFSRLASVWYSDDGGSSWTSAGTWNHGGIGGRQAFMSPQIALDPITGHLWITATWAEGGFFGGNWNATWRSTNNGASWSKIANVAFGIQPFADDGTLMYTVHSGDPGGQIHSFDGTTLTHEEYVWDPSKALDDYPSGVNFNHLVYDADEHVDSNGSRARFIVDGGKMHYFACQYVGGPLRTWWAGETGFMG